MPNKIDNGTISHRNRAARHSLSEGLSSMRLMVGKYVVIGGNMQPRSKGGAGRAAQLQASGSPTTSLASTGRSRKAPPPTGCGITSPSRASSPVPAGSPPRPAQQAEGASPRSHRTAPSRHHPTKERTTANAFFHMTRRRGSKPIFTRTPVDMSSETARVSRGVPSISKSDTSWKKRPACVTFSHVPVTG